MASGLPVISTYHGGIPHVIENGKTGLLIQEKDEKQLTVFLKELFYSKNLRQSIGGRAREYASEHLDLHKKAVQLQRIYESILRNKD